MKTLVVLAGGLGTRLRSLVHDVPKPMAPVLNRPFVSWLIEAWVDLDIGFEQIVLSVGYKSEAIYRYFGTQYKGIPITYSAEKEPLGTGGALISACRVVNSQICVVNGDTWFLPSRGFSWPTEDSGSEMCFLLKYLDNSSRYGSITLSNTGNITQVRSNNVGGGYVNGGVYFINRQAVDFIGQHRIAPRPLSLENELFPTWIDDKNFKLVGRVIEQPFLDIGITADYLESETFITTNFRSFRSIK